MRKNFKILLLFVVFICILCGLKIQSINSQRAITYVLNGGRFGDCLLNYSKAKYLAYKYDIDFYYFPFQYCDSLKICELDKEYKSGMEKKYEKVVKFYEDTKFKLDPKNTVKIDERNSYFYVSNYYADIPVDWTNKGFIKELKRTISPRIAIEKLNLPKDRISVALHVRKGGGHDNPLFSDPEAQSNGKKSWGFSDKGYPLKFPPDSFYIEQIKKLYEIVYKAPLYIYIFTDDTNPGRIAEKYKKALDGLNIEFDYRKSVNRHNSNVVEDFFTMTQFDCLIRNGSNFSFMVDMIGDFSIVIALDKAHWEGDNWIADKIDVKVKSGINKS